MFGRKQNLTELGASSIDYSQKEWKLIERVVMANTAELKRHRRWSIFFKLLTFSYLFLMLLFFWGKVSDVEDVRATGGHTAVVDVKGVIADDKKASAANIISALNSAIEHPDTKAVVLRINSPGGSPVQSAYIYDEIMRLRERHPDVPFYSVIVDSGASGAYYIASATQEIFANSSSIVGSIGVTASNFGFQNLIEELGIERRMYTSGEHKGFLDSFVSADPEEVAFFEKMLQSVHQQFIEDVQRGRGERLVAPDENKLFTGLFWSGRQAVELGLIDGLKSTEQLARELQVPRLVEFSQQLSMLEQFAKDLGVSIVHSLDKLDSVSSIKLY